MTKTVEGKVLYISDKLAIPGIKFEEQQDKWYNGAHKEQRVLVTEGLKGKLVRLELNEKGRFETLHVLPDKEYSVSCMHDHVDVRVAAANAAAELCGRTDDVDQFFSVAAQIESWITRGTR